MDRSQGRPVDLGVALEDAAERAGPVDAPMLEITIRLLGWRRGDAEIEATLFPGALPGDPFRAPSPEADQILDRLHSRLREELAEAFETFRRP